MVMKEMMTYYVQTGEVTFVSVRPGRKKPVQVPEEVNAIAGKGLEGDRYHAEGGSRQVTLIQHEHLEAVASFLGKEKINPDQTRRNIVVKGINLLSLKGKKFKIGEAVMEYSGECHPCSRMEENLGEGGYNAMRGHGGITAIVTQSGRIKIGSRVSALKEQKMPGTS